MLEVGKVFESILTAACICTACRKLHFQWKTRRMSEGHPSWKVPGPSSFYCGLYIVPVAWAYIQTPSTTVWDQGWGEGICLSASVCDPNSEFSARLFPKMICQWEFYWSSSDTLKNALWSTGVSCSSLKVSEVWDISHTEEWPCPAVVQACMAI